MFPFSAIVTATGVITFTSRDGTSNTIARDNARYEEAKEILRQITDAEEDDRDDLISDLVSIASPVKAIASDTGGRVFVKDGKVYFRDASENDPTIVHNVVAERIVWMIAEGFDAKPMLSFLDFLMDNPSYRSVNDLYRFMERNQMGITPDGHLLAYKKVRSNFRDIHSGTFDNTPGQRPKMRRNEVEDNPERTCSNGLHVCSYTYLPHFGTSGATDRVVVCKVNPRDVVSVPVDYSDAKMRVCEYLVLKEIDYRQTGDVLGSRPVIDEEIAPNKEDIETCPSCGSDVGDANFCDSCGWERYTTDDLDDDLDDELNDDADDDNDADDAIADAIKAEMEEPPVIEFKQGDRWQELFGHNCSTRAEAEHYVASLGSSGLRLRPVAAPEVAEQPVESAPATEWPKRGEDKAVDLRDAVTGVTEAAAGLFGENAVAVHIRLDGEGGLEVKMRPDSSLMAKTKQIIVDHLGVEYDKVVPSASIMADLGADSLDVIELVMAFEEEFGIEIEDSDKRDMSVEQIVAELERRVERPV